MGKFFICKIYQNDSSPCNSNPFKRLTALRLTDSRLADSMLFRKSGDALEIDMLRQLEQFVHLQ